MTRCTVGLLVIGFGTLYLLTAQHGISWGDSGFFQRRILEHDLAGGTELGLAIAHPLFIWSAGLFSQMFPPALRIWAMNAICGVWAALATGMMFLCAKSFTKSRSAAVLAALTLGCAHMFWWLSTMSEVYTLSVLLLACEMYALLAAVQRRQPWLMVAVFFANGLHFSDHNFALLSLPTEAVAALWLVFKAPHGKRKLAQLTGLGTAALAAWCIGALPILTLACGRYKLLGSITATVLDVLVGKFGTAVSGTQIISLRLLLFNYVLAGISFALPCWFLAAKSLWGLRRNFTGLRHLRPETYFLIAIFLFHFVFWIRYQVGDQATFLLPTLFMATLLASPAFGTTHRPIVWGVATVATSVALPLLIVAALSPTPDPLIKKRGRLPFRNDLIYFALPWKHNEDSAARFAAAAVKKLPHMSMVYVDNTVGNPLACAKRLGQLPSDVQLTVDGTFTFPPSSRWEVRPFPGYRLSPPEATVVQRDIFYEVILPD